MYQTMQHLNDEHMRLYEWTGAGAGTTLTDAIPEKSKRTHAWHASYSVLALLTSLLAMNGCNNKGPAEQATREMQREEARPPVSENSPGAGAAEQAAPAQDAPGEQSGSTMQKP